MSKASARGIFAQLFIILHLVILVLKGGAFVKVINKSRILELLRNYLFVFSLIYITLLSFAITSQERIELFSYLMPPEYMGLEIFSIATGTFLSLFAIFGFVVGLHLYRVLSKEYIRVWEDFVEGPNSQGNRVLLSFTQIQYMGRDLLGRFSMDGQEECVVLPGKLSIETEREILRKIKQARLKNNL